APSPTAASISPGTAARSPLASRSARANEEASTPAYRMPAAMSASDGSWIFGSPSRITATFWARASLTGFGSRLGVGPPVQPGSASNPPAVTAAIHDQAANALFFDDIIIFRILPRLASSASEPLHDGKPSGSRPAGRVPLGRGSPLAQV